MSDNRDNCGGEVLVLLITAVVISVGLLAYGGMRQSDGFRYGYIAGYAESKADLPSRHSLPDKLRQEEGKP